MSSVRVIELHTSEGPLSVQLYDDEAPHQCTAFTRLAESGQLNGPLFRQMIPGFALVADAYQCREQDTVYGLLDGADATVNPPASSLHHVGAGLFTCAFEAGSVSTARFLVTLGPQPLLDREYTVFGRLYSGLAVLSRIAKMQTDSHGNLFSPIIVHRCNVVKVPAVAVPTTAVEGTPTNHAKPASKPAGKSKLLSQLVDEAITSAV